MKEVSVPDYRSVRKYNERLGTKIVLKRTLCVRSGRLQGKVALSSAVDWVLDVEGEMFTRSARETFTVSDVFFLPCHT